jgi:hypothetical protein
LASVRPLFGRLFIDELRVKGAPKFGEELNRFAEVDDWQIYEN